MREKPTTANIVKRDGVYHLLMLVEGRWLETGITSRKFLEITQIADREFPKVLLNAPLTPPPAAGDAAMTAATDEREGDAAAAAPVSKPRARAS
jgi:hypothetical protein